MGKCKACGSRMIDTGPPLWESFCSNEKCTHDHDTFWDNFRKRSQERQRIQKIKDAGPELLEALKAVTGHEDYMGMTFSDRMELVKKAFAKVEGKE